MRVEIQKKVSGLTAEITEKIAGEIRQHVASLAECTCPVGSYGPCTCQAAYVGNPSNIDGGFVQLSHYGESIGIEQADTSLRVFYNTCGSWEHGVEIDPEEGYIVAHSNGARSSDGWGMAFCSATLREILEREAGQGWQILSVETSKPEWGILHWLAGRLKEGPASEREASQ